MGLRCVLIFDFSRPMIFCDCGAGTRVFLDTANCRTEAVWISSLMLVLVVYLIFLPIFLQTLYVRFVLGGNHLGMSANFWQIKIRLVIRSEKIVTYLTCPIGQDLFDRPNLLFVESI